MESQIEELKELVRENTKLTQETRAMVKSLRNAARWARAFKLLWIGLIVALSFGAYIYLAPYIQQVLGLYQGAQQALEQAREFGSQFQGQSEQ